MLQYVEALQITDRRLSDLVDSQAQSTKNTRAAQLTRFFGEELDGESDSDTDEESDSSESNSSLDDEKLTPEAKTQFRQK